jgi:TolB-like protein/class 3 adenylate cyclase
MSEIRKLAAILVADVVGYSRLAGADEDRTLARLRGLRSDLIDPAVAAHHGRIVKRTGDGSIIEFRSVVDSVRCAIEVQSGMFERNAGVPLERRIEFRVGIHLGDVVEESDGDLMGDGVNIAARLEGVAKPGAICLSEDAYRQVKSRLDLMVSDLGPIQLKNIAEPVRVYSLETGTRAEAKPAPFAPAPDRSGPPRLSIVVLPFANIGGDPEQEYFVDGVTESLTTDLSRISGSFVIARNSAFSYKDRRIDVRTIGRELNVRYVLEGRVQRGGSRMRVNVQLIDAESGAHLWAERFDKPLADIFDMQDEIVAHLARQLDTALISAEAHRAAQLSRPDALDLHFQGMAWANKGISLDHLRRAGDFFKRALALHPDEVGSLTGEACVEMTLAGAYPNEDRDARLAKATAALTRALRLAPNHAQAHLVLGRVEILMNRGVQAIVECDRALALDRNLAAAHAAIGLAKVFIGRAEDSEDHVREALRISPRDTFAFSWLATAGLAKLYLGSDEEAMAYFRRAIELNRDLPNAYFYLAASFANIGRLDEAHRSTSAGLSINPTYTISGFRAASISDNPTFLAQRERVYEGMRKAGVPEE